MDTFFLSVGLTGWGLLDGNSSTAILKTKKRMAPMSRAFHTEKSMIIFFSFGRGAAENDVMKRRYTINRRKQNFMFFEAIGRSKM